MRIHAITVSCDYAPELARGIAGWLSGLATLVVVTAPRDEETIALARQHGATLHQTEAFWRGGAYFAKAAAMEEARALLPADGWFLFLDADLVPSDDWLERVTAQAPEPGVLHGARRVREDGTPIPDRELAGFFQLWHHDDPRGKAPLATNRTNASGYDSLFMQRWPRQLQRILDLELVHLGEPGVNWCGKGNESAMAEIREARRRGRSWRQEVIP